MSRVMMGATVSVDGFVADEDDAVGPLFDWHGNGDVALTLGDPDRVFRVGAASAEHVRRAWSGVRVTVVGRRLFDLTNGWDGRPPVGGHVVVVTHAPPADWPFPDAPFTFVTDGVASAVARARELAGDGDVSVAAGDVGGQALAAGLVDEVHTDIAPVVLGRGRPFFGSEDVGRHLLEDPEVVRGDRVLHLVYRVRR